MSHHFGQDFNQKPLQDWAKDLGLGATNNFPDGKIDPKDQGEIKLDITVKDNTVIIAFGKSIEWIGFTRQQAMQIGQTLLDRARQID